MAKGRSAAALVVGLAFGALLLYLAYAAIVTFGSASDNIKVTIVAGIVSLVSVFAARYFEQRRELNQKINAEKIRVYATIIDILFSFFRPPKEASDMPKDQGAIAEPGDEVIDRLRSAQKELLFWGSDPVIKSWIEFMAEMQNKQDMTPERLASAMTNFGKLIVSMRRDVGYQFTQISAYHIARMILAPGVEEDRLLETIRGQKEKGAARP